MDYNSRATKLETLSREELKRAAKILKLKGYGNKNKTELISAIMAMVAMRQALRIKDKPKLKKQFLAKMKKEMLEFEKELEKITAQQPEV